MNISALKISMMKGEITFTEYIFCISGIAEIPCVSISIWWMDANTCFFVHFKMLILLGNTDAIS